MGGQDGAEAFRLLTRLDRLLEISLSRANLRRLRGAINPLASEKSATSRGAIGRDCGQAPMKEAGRPATGGFRLFAPGHSGAARGAGAFGMRFGNAGRARVVFGCGRGRWLALTKENDLSPSPTNAGNAFVSPPFETAASLDDFIEKGGQGPTLALSDDSMGEHVCG